MTPERWERIKEIFGTALEKPAPERGAYLDSACGGDAELRAEVEKLLAGSEEPSLRSPAIATELTSGEMLAQYRIKAKLGEGGMGAVYRAYDTRLHRQVAVKVLLPDPAPDPERKSRLLREARAASALNHPNIVTIHEIGTAGGQDFIAMEYVEGRPLSQVIPSKGLPVAKALDYAVQIAGALSAAHAAGVVHRDLKPANVMVTEAGRVKLLDFGLARRVRLTGDETATLSVQGEIAGTPAYMSPEQAEGKKADKRTDVFAFGAVLYEMLSGRRAFQGDTTLAVLGAVLKEEPKPLTGVPRELVRIVELCLKKDPAHRLQHIDDVKILFETTCVAEPAPAAPATRRWLLAAALAAVTIVLGLSGIALWHSRKPAPIEPPRVTRLTSDSGLTIQPAISPDGKLLAYVSDRGGAGNLDIWLKHLGGGPPIRITFDPAGDTQPVFSPDGGQIAFRSERDGGGIYVIPALGGDVRLVAREGRNPRFSPDGSQIAYWVGVPILDTAGGAITAGIYVTATTGGSPRPIQPEFRQARHPIWTPDGKHLLFAGVREPGGDFDWWAAPVDGGPAARIGVRRLVGSYHFRPNALIGKGILYSTAFGDTSSLWMLPISPGTWRALGEPRRLTFGAGGEFDPSVSSSGQVVFAAVVSSCDLWSLPVDANQARVTGELQRLTQEPTPHHHVSLSRNGQLTAYIAYEDFKLRIRVRELGTGRDRALTQNPAGQLYTAFSADGSKVLLTDDQSPQQEFYIVPSQGGVAEKASNRGGRAPHWSANGRYVVYDNGVPRYVGALDLTTGENSEILKHPKYGVLQAQLSPDDRWISFAVQTRHGSTRLMVAPFRGTTPVPESEWVALTDEVGFSVRPRWSPDGSVLYFVSNRDAVSCIWAVKLDPSTKKPAGAPFAVRHFHNHRLLLMYPPALGFGVAPDKMVFNMEERTGNIWTFQLPQER